MSKKYLVIALILLILVLAGGSYFLWKTQTPKPVADAITTVIPEESVPTTNPYEKTNPFSNIKINPFE